MAGFSAGVGKWAEDTAGEIGRLYKAIILELFSSVILDTPVLTGRLRGNWIISPDDPDTGTLEIEDASGEKTVAKVENFLDKLDGSEDFKVYLSNNLPYAHRIEFDGWSHTKAPEGMVRKNFIRITSLLNTRFK